MSMAGFIFRLMFKHSMCIWGEQTVPCQTALLTAGRSHPLLSCALTLPGQSFLLLSKSIWALTSPHDRDIWFLSPCSPTLSPLAAGDLHLPRFGKGWDIQHGSMQVRETATGCFVCSVNLQKSSVIPCKLL